MASFIQKVTLLLAASSVVSAIPAKRDASVCTEIRQRVPWTSLTQEEKDAYIQADLCLINAPSKGEISGAVTRWDDLQWPHVVQTDSVHFVGAFLPFHRYYMTAHERMIKDECGYTGRMPYWDETADIGKLTESELWSDEYFGGDGRSSDRCVTTGSFANLTLRWQQDATVSEHCLTRRFNERSLQEASLEVIANCYAIDNYNEAWECLSNGPHGAGHGGVGGIMSDPTLSPGDPVFYLHHSWLDKIWWRWQEGNLTARLTDMGGPNIPGRGAFPGGGGNLPGNGKGTGPEFTDYFGDNGNVTTLNHRLYMAEIFPNITIADVMDIGGDVICSEYID
ncbi:hypothetical protein G7054_g12090 [Neopestalotiopsis clavispora]|nr:hypothetical protein G7054_g12090 [Neopestalotiopsis clavispora]